MQFHIREVLSITTEIVMRDHDETPGEAPFDCVYKVCDFMRGYAHDTIELLAASEPCRNEIYRQHPWLRVVSDKVCEDIRAMRAATPDEEEFQVKFRAYYRNFDKTYPDPVELRPIPPDDNKPIPTSLEILRGINPVAVVFRLDGMSGEVEEATENSEGLS